VCVCVRERERERVCERERWGGASDRVKYTYIIIVYKIVSSVRFDIRRSETKRFGTLI